MTSATSLPSPSDPPAIDPVCGMEVDPAESEFTLETHDGIVHFCCNGCRLKFSRDPAAYSGAASARNADGTSKPSANGAASPADP